MTDQELEEIEKLFYPYKAGDVIDWPQMSAFYSKIPLLLEEIKRLRHGPFVYSQEETNVLWLKADRPPISYKVKARLVILEPEEKPREDLPVCNPV